MWIFSFFFSLHLPDRESEDRLSCCCILNVGSSVRLSVSVRVCESLHELQRVWVRLNCVFWWRSPRSSSGSETQSREEETSSFITSPSVPRSHSHFLLSSLSLSLSLVPVSSHVYVRAENTTCKCRLWFMRVHRGRVDGRSMEEGGRGWSSGRRRCWRKKKKKGREKAITLRKAYSLRHQTITLPSPPRHLATRNARAI